MVSSASLNWPTDREKELGLALIIFERDANYPGWFLSLSHDFYYGCSKLVASIRKITTAVIIPFGLVFTKYLELNSGKLVKPQREPTDLERVFIVHGRDEAPREMVARFVTDLGLKPVILHEQASRGMTGAVIALALS